MCKSAPAAMMFAALMVVAALLLLLASRAAEPAPAALSPQLSPAAPVDVIPKLRLVDPPRVAGPRPGIQPFASADYPLSRVREAREKSTVLQPYYPDRRVMFRRIRIDPVGAGMEISGQVITDFDCDCAPAEHNLKSGPIIGLRIKMQLFDITPFLERGEDGQVQDAPIDVRSPGRPLPGQVVECLTSASISDGGPRFGLANFKLPVMPRPLAPGVYHLVAAVRFLSQGREQLEQIKWCSDFWGVDDEGLDPLQQKRRVFPVIGDAERHARYFREVTTVLREVTRSVRIYVAETTVAPSSGSSEVIWCQLAE